MTVVGCGIDVRVVIAFTNEDGIETAVKTIFSNNLMRTQQGLILSDKLVRDPPSEPQYRTMLKNGCLKS